MNNNAADRKTDEIKPGKIRDEKGKWTFLKLCLEPIKAYNTRQHLYFQYL